MKFIMYILVIYLGFNLARSFNNDSPLESVLVIALLAGAWFIITKVEEERE